MFLKFEVLKCNHPKIKGRNLYFSLDIIQIRIQKEKKLQIAYLEIIILKYRFIFIYL